MFLWRLISEKLGAALVLDQKNINNFINLIYYLLSHFSRVPILSTLGTAALPGSPVPQDSAQA